MPTYEHECPNCGATAERVSRVADRDAPLDCDCGASMRRVILTAPMGQPDIAAYTATAGDMAGRPITSRREHREYLKRNRLREVGNDMPKDTRKLRTTKLTPEQRHELRATIRSELRRRVPRSVLEKRG